MTKVEQWAEIYRTGTDGQIKSVIKTFYNMKAWHELHIALWVWLAIDGERGKGVGKTEWFNKFKVPEVMSYCFACEAAKKCVNCPMERNRSGWCADGLFIDWVYTKDKTKREELARRIAEMEWHGQK